MASKPEKAAPLEQLSSYRSVHSVEELTEHNVQTIIQLEKAAIQDRSRTESLVDSITGFFGRLAVIYVHIGWFIIWLGWNFLMPQPLRFDPYPFEFLVFTLSLEAIFLSIFILISQNRQAKLDERRNHLELQIALLSEQENTKMLWMLERIAEHVGADITGDPDVQVLEEATRPETLLEQIDRTLEETEKQKPTE